MTASKGIGVQARIASFRLLQDESSENEKSETPSTIAQMNEKPDIVEYLIAQSARK
jgi:hypothetical protein